jgi:NADH-quinone oxidoreductase subunit E
MSDQQSIGEQIDDILTPNKRERKNLISLLQQVQDRLGYLPREAMLEVSKFLGVAEVQVFSVATFYNQFRMKPVGRYPVEVCMGTACHLKGGQFILEEFERQLGIKVEETTTDGNFSLHRVACMGCCMLAPVVKMGDRAPVIRIGNKLYPKMTPFKVEEVLIPYRAEIRQKPGEEQVGAGKQEKR